MRTATKTAELWFYLPATVVSAAAADGTYEVIYKGKLPPGDPFATVHVAHDQIVPEKPSPPKPLPSRTAASKTSEMVPAARPTTAGKSLRLIRKIASEMQKPPRPTTTAEKSLSLVHNVASEMQPQPRPTTGGKSLHVVRKILSEMKACSQGYVT
jgi:hypothetical protein